MKRESLSADKRSVLGKKVKKLRRDGIMPANVYGQGHKSVAIQIPIKEFMTVYKSAGETGVVDLSFEKETLPVLIHSVQKEPRTQDVLHVDFLVVNLKQKITTRVPLAAVGEAVAVKDKLGILIQVHPDVEIEALPTDLPEKVEVDVQTLANVGDHILVGDIKAPSTFTIITDPTQIAFKIDELVQKVEEPEAAPAEEGAEGAEGETPADDQAQTAEEGGSEPSETQSEE